MALIKSISGIRGTIGGKAGETLSPLDVVRFTSAYATWLKNSPEFVHINQNKKVVVGRDGRISGELLQRLVVSTLNSVGIDVIDIGLTTTPTLEMSVIFEEAHGGIILTASHNPKEWNALKLLNHKGEFISAKDGELILDIAKYEKFDFVGVDKLGTYKVDETQLDKHIQAIVRHPLVDVEAIKSRSFNIYLDAINSTGAQAVPALLQKLGVDSCKVINGEINGKFAHNPEPLPQNLRDLCSLVGKNDNTIGIAVDPDVDRLCFVCEDGTLFGEEYTLVAVADYVLRNKPGSCVSNMSSTRALKDVAHRHGCNYFSSAVGEVNVVQKMKDVDAVIGGEGNGGIIVPDLHYGRDALIGIALFLTHLAKEKKTAKQLRNTYPDYFISKNKIELANDVDFKKILNGITEKYKNYPINTEDGVKIEFERDWVHLRVSNTEPIIRIYAESNFETTAENIARRMMQDIREVM